MSNIFVDLIVTTNTIFEGNDNSMVRVDLDYNPYILKTEVLFNGNPPRINSLVEKYQNEKLQTWIKQVPSIFHDEMNGFGFELVFSGTDKDYAELTNAFTRAGVKKEQVSLFHKGNLKSRYEKSIAIDDLLNWLNDNPDRTFDYSSFFENNRDLFEGAYSLVVVGGEWTSEVLFDDFDVTVESVKSLDELKKTDLRSTPILMYITIESLHTLRHDLHELLCRDDVDPNQVFFIIKHGVSENVVRVIKDLGFHDPQVVTSAEDERIHSYLELYPVSEYIIESIKVLSAKAEELNKIIEERNRENEESNKEVYDKIKGSDDILTRLKKSHDQFHNRDNLELPEGFLKEKKILLDGLNSWRNKRTKITQDSEAVIASQEYEAFIKNFFQKFESGLTKICGAKSVELMKLCDKWYQIAECGDTFSPDISMMVDFSNGWIPGISEELLKIKEEQFVEPKQKDDFFGFFFKAATDTPKEKVLETAYYYEKWRSYATLIIEPIAEKVIQDAYDSIKQYYYRLIEAYSLRLENMIQENTEKKQKVLNQLSEEERMQQYDNDWVTTFWGKIRDIERL